MEKHVELCVVSPEANSLASVENYQMEPST